MIRAQGPLQAMEPAELEWTEAGEPRSVRYGDCYFSAEDGLAESQYVFIDGSDLEKRLTIPSASLFTIGELGFGTGLNFLLSWRCFQRFASPGKRLHFWSVDRHPLSLPALEKSLRRWPELADLAAELLSAYPPPLPGVHRRVFDGGRVTLDLIWAEAEDALAELAGLDVPLIDAWYLDGFAPRQNESMWTVPLFEHMVRASKLSASLATYSASGQVRRSLSRVGFSMNKRPGFGKKRECLQGSLHATQSDPQAERSSAPTLTPTLTPWDLSPHPPANANQTALVIGAGLAGAHVAAALGRRGMAVTVLDEGAAAGGGSGNAQGVLFTRLSHERSILGEFSLLAFLYARDLYRRMFQDGLLREGRDGELNGCVQTDMPRGDTSSLAEALRGLEAVAEPRDVESVEHLLGVRSGTAGIWQPGSGWLAPPAVCRALLDQPGISLQEHCGHLSFHCENGQWEARNPEGHRQGLGDLLILATGPSGRRIAQTGDLPLRVVRGQTTQIPAPRDQPLRTSLCHRGYIAPAVNGEHCIGATFKPGDESRELRVEEHRDNIAALARALPAWEDHLMSLDPTQLKGRAELRCVSPDYLPLAGPLPDIAAFEERFRPLQWDASQLIPLTGAYQRGLYMSTAHGSRGLSYAALSGEFIAARIFGEPPPLSRELQRALSPARFLIRGLIRGKAPAKVAGA
ncbi:bifunctional tRNA (5-methylaminomethyl-2-thiouridine)(34)-methyltransferase MnmD/FAD-dependent 5-carboxymethylaminomethyl-2-thiouridine(34) oxidoreductase MnmC [Congregibacter litoralis]|uniref:tRNA 5-methylaminomethyl-2-thiouridine biosynthesis bifunctional protein MnmC n=1 Tax=Congregibacter litoralis KT71 TaxID=314285 RepID=A4ACD5_9GAMM|nr:bifunctional tRNA (5-methylaminomethyl-2-thiouridine)(34)-methyltransferase MnmD/FAD-dependent 5-carboxymethylaminomethyl-2-thiouridine(34) oxidoreductase MnmC [Congregibacter litoralis]EAQ96363.1 tRNA U-34 5-methylaminomethyl-2-thiouridine biosynthesis protein MnmC, C-terminal domain protein [Congregibacter litoralis KT71]